MAGGVTRVVRRGLNYSVRRVASGSGCSKELKFLGNKVGTSVKEADSVGPVSGGPRSCSLVVVKAPI